MKTIIRILLITAVVYCSAVSSFGQFIGLELHHYATPQKPSNSVVDWNVPTGSQTYRLYARFQNSTDCMSMFGGIEDQPMIIYSTEAFFNSAFEGFTDSRLVEVIPEIAYDTWLTIGDLNENYNFQSLLALEADRKNLAIHKADIANKNVIAFLSEMGGGMFHYSGISSPAGDDHLILLGQFTTTGTIHFGGMLIQSYPEGNKENAKVDYVTEWTTVGIKGCGDASACNYRPDLEADNSLCAYENCGCTCKLACNYNSNATSDDNSCKFLHGKYTMAFNSLYVIAPEAEQYTWFYNDQPVETANDYIMEIQGQGNYRVDMMTMEGCQHTSQITLQESDLDWSVNDSYTYFIDPDKEELYVQFTNKGWRNIELIDNSGVSVRRMVLRNGIYVIIPLTNLRKGYYYLEVTYHGDTERKTINYLHGTY
ncbi:MAG: hypothetical protein KDC12_05205 [Flavobacteriales bacterium]|nr:hypothetical protein [Flavobacteriales bacterium]